MSSEKPLSTSVSLLTSDEELSVVKEIYRESKQLLGFLPDGAFQERLQKKQILAVRLNDHIVGYLLFSTTQRDEIRIVHLAIRNDCRGLGLSSLLIATLKDTFPHYSRIRLNCREDFIAAKIWPLLGFFEYGRTIGKKANGSVLIKYQMALNDMPLFDLTKKSRILPTIICDTNVCLDILLESRSRHEAACGLLEDWIADEVELAITDELFKDLRRIDDHIPSDCGQRIRMIGWREVKSSQLEVLETLRKIENILGPPRDESAVSDQLHLATAALHDAVAFATYDQELLNHSAELLSCIGIRVQRPSEIITDIDSVVRAQIYRAKDLSNTGLERVRLRSLSDLDSDQFVKASHGERKKDLEGYIDNALSNPGRFLVHHIRNQTNSSIGILGLEQINEFTWSLDLLRTAHKLTGSIAGNTLAQYMCHQPLGAWHGSNIKIVRVPGTGLRPEFIAPLQDRGFICDDDIYWRISLPGFWDLENLVDKLGMLSEQHGLPAAIMRKLSQLAFESAENNDQRSAQLLEQLIHPGKLRFGNLPTYVIPIQPRWARELFDFRIWDRPLIKPETNLIINPDSVYYKRPKNSPATQFGRILWYVSGSTTQGGNAVRACSMLTEGVSGTVKNLFRNFESLGVFEWPQLIEHFGSAEALAFAIQFTNTELLPSPITFDETNDILEEYGMKRQIFNSCIQLNQDAFEPIYIRGMGI